MSLTLNSSSLSVIGKGYNNTSYDSGSGVPIWESVPKTDTNISTIDLSNSVLNYIGSSINNNFDTSILDNMFDNSNLYFNGDGIYINQSLIPTVGTAIYNAGGFNGIYTNSSNIKYVKTKTIVLGYIYKGYINIVFYANFSDYIKYMVLVDDSIRPRERWLLVVPYDFDNYNSLTCNIRFDAYKYLSSRWTYETAVANYSSSTTKYTVDSVEWPIDLDVDNYSHAYLDFVGYKGNDYAYLLFKNEATWDAPYIQWGVSSSDDSSDSINNVVLSGKVTPCGSPTFTDLVSLSSEDYLFHTYDVHELAERFINGDATDFTSNITGFNTNDTAANIDWNSSSLQSDLDSTFPSISSNSTTINGTLYTKLFGLTGIN